MHHYAVVGRIPGDDEDTVYCFDCLSPKADDDLIELFTIKIYADTERDRTYFENVDESAVYINAILESASPIRVRSC